MTCEVQASAERLRRMRRNVGQPPATLGLLFYVCCPTRLTKGPHKAGRKKQSPRLFRNRRPKCRYGRLQFRIRRGPNRVIRDFIQARLPALCQEVLYHDMSTEGFVGIFSVVVYCCPRIEPNARHEILCYRAFGTVGLSGLSDGFGESTDVCSSPFSSITPSFRLSLPPSGAASGNTSESGRIKAGADRRSRYQS